MKAPPLQTCQSQRKAKIAFANKQSAAKTGAGCKVELVWCFVELLQFNGWRVASYGLLNCINQRSSSEFIRHCQHPLQI